ncbi:MAG: DNA mismatch repair protein [Polyangiaceae bacterium]
MAELTVPDLLDPTPRTRIDREQTKFGITMAFAGSTSGGLFADALDKAALPASSWDPRGFAEDLFLQRFAAQYFSLASPEGAEISLTSPRYLVRALSQPPSDPRAVGFRTDILRELVEAPALRAALTGLHRDLARTRALLENTGAMKSYDRNRQRLDTLGAMKQVIDRLGEFALARSGLARLGALGKELREGEPYRSLTDLLGYDAKLATLNLKVSVGADGQIRAFDVLSIEESNENAFVNPFWRRWLARFELFLRGYSFSKGEVLARLIDSVFTGLEDAVVLFVQLLGDVEFYLGALGFRDRTERAGLVTSLAVLVSRDEPRELRGLFNPLLFFSGTTPVPCDVVVNATTSATLITGPNSGGKTRLLQSIALTQLLAQNGLFVPARVARVTLASGLVASLIEGTKADQSEGRLGMEMMRIRGLFERLPPNAMVLLDELCSGTNPSEGERIVELVLGMLHRLRPQAFITTHFLAFADRLAQAGTVPGLSFVQVEINAERRPTYQFKPGVAKSSLAEATAERLGVTGDQLLSLVEENLRRHAATSPQRG